MAEMMFIMTLLFVFVSLCPVTFAEPVIETTTTTDDAVSELNQIDQVQNPYEPKCGNEDIYIYDAVNDRCLINFKKVMKRTVVIYEKNNVEFLPDDEMARSIYVEGENLFKGIMISVILFMTCASVCVVSACIYCCRINVTDRTLKHNVKSLAKKLNRNYNTKNAPKRPPLPIASETCAVVVEPAGVFVA